MKNESGVTQVKAKATKQDVLLSQAALSHIKKEITKQDEPILGVRFSVKKTGCSGLSYVVDYVKTINQEDKQYQIEDLTVYIDRKAYPYLSGMKVDYIKEGLNYRFVFTNPNQTGECGCGESFTVDERFRQE